jgi:hypothetical protein
MKRIGGIAMCRELLMMVAVLGLAVTTGAEAALEITADKVDADGKTSPQNLYVLPDRMKIDTDRFTMIYRTDTGKAINIMKDKHQYMEIDPKAMAAGMNAAQAAMQKQLQSLPEAQRKQIEAAMGHSAGGMMMGQGLDITYEKTSQTKQIGSWSCTVVHQKTNGTLSADLCMTPISTLGVTHDDLAVFKAFAESMRNALGSFGGRSLDMLDFEAQTKQIGFEGMPVETVLYIDGKVRSTTTLKTIEHKPISLDVFDVPAGYTKQDMPHFPTGGGNQ